MKINPFFYLSKRFKRKPKVTYSVCPTCQKQAVSDPTKVSAKPVASVDYSNLLLRAMAPRVAIEVLAIDDLRRRLSTGHPLRDQMLSDIQNSFMQNVIDLGRQLRRNDEQEGQL